MYGDVLEVAKNVLKPCGGYRYSVRSGALFISVNFAQWCIKQKEPKTFCYRLPETKITQTFCTAGPFKEAH